VKNLQKNDLIIETIETADFFKTPTEKRKKDITLKDHYPQQID
jgi:hypothetical protein